MAQRIFSNNARTLSQPIRLTLIITPGGPPEGSIYVGGNSVRTVEEWREEMAITKALEAYGKYFNSIAAIVLPVGILVGLILLGISNSRNETLQLLMAFNVPGVLLSPLWIGPLIYGLSWHDSGQECGYKTAVLKGWKSWWKLMIVAVIVIGIKCIPVAGSKIVPLPGFWFLLLTGGIAVFLFARYVFILPVLILESRGLIQSLRRSAVLSEGRRVSIVFEFIALWFLLYVVVFIMTMILGQMANLIGGLISLYIYFILIMGVIQPMMYALIVVWIYYFYLAQDREMTIKA